jgi:hypothetical protein
MNVIFNVVKTIIWLQVDNFFVSNSASRQSKTERARVKVPCHESARCAELEAPFRMQRYITIII